MRIISTIVYWAALGGLCFFCWNLPLGYYIGAMLCANVMWLAEAIKNIYR